MAEGFCVKFCSGCGERSNQSPCAGCISGETSAAEIAHCDTCLNSSPRLYTAAELYCADCTSNYCLTHAQSHQTCYGHECVRIKSIKYQHQGQGRHTCPKHQNSAYTSGCSICYKTMCDDCVSEDCSAAVVAGMDSTNNLCEQGRSHKLAPIAQLANNARWKAAIFITEGISHIDKLQSLERALLERLSEFDESTTQMRQLIHNAEEKQLSEITSKYEDMESCLMSSREESRSKLENYHHNEIQCRLNDVKSSVDNVKSLPTSETQVDMNLIMTVGNIERSTREFMKSLPSLRVPCACVRLRDPVPQRVIDCELLEDMDIVLEGTESSSVSDNEPITSACRPSQNVDTTLNDLMQQRDVLIHTDVISNSSDPPLSESLTMKLMKLMRPGSYRVGPSAQHGVPTILNRQLSSAETMLHPPQLKPELSRADTIHQLQPLNRQLSSSDTMLHLSQLSCQLTDTTLNPPTLSCQISGPGTRPRLPQLNPQLSDTITPRPPEDGAPPDYQAYLKLAGRGNADGQSSVTSCPLNITNNPQAVRRNTCTEPPSLQASAQNPMPEPDIVTNSSAAEHLARQVSLSIPTKYMNPVRCVDIFQQKKPAKQKVGTAGTYVCCDDQLNVYIGLPSGELHKIMRDNQTAQLLSTTEGDGRIVSIAAYRNYLYVLLISRLLNTYLRVFDSTTGRHLHTTPLTKRGQNITSQTSGSIMSIFKDHICILNSVSRTDLTIDKYSILDGGRPKKCSPVTVKGSIFGAQNISVCGAGWSDCIIVCDQQLCTISKLNINTGLMMWTSKNVTNPLGVACDGEYVAVSSSDHQGKATICILDFYTGVCTNEIRSDTVERMPINLFLRGNLLIIPESFLKVNFYELNPQLTLRTQNHFNKSQMIR